MKNLDKLFNPKSIAIVGASPKKNKLGNILLQNIIFGGWKGQIYCVNPNYKRIGKYKCFANLGDIQKPIDLVLVAIPAPLVNQVIEDGAQASPKIENYAIISSGFKETGPSGKKLEDELKNKAQEYNLNILGPNCLGFINPVKKLNATFTESQIEPGKVAIVSQSGALEVALLDWAESQRVGFSKVISIGNKAILGENEMLEFLGRDKETKVIAFYLEDMESGQKFLELAGSIIDKKPVIVIKAGKSQFGQAAISSHTGSLAQDSAVIEAAFSKLGAIEADSMEQFQDIIAYLDINEIPKGKDVIILTNAGGPGVLAADFVGQSRNLSLFKFPRDLSQKLKHILPPSAATENPIDILGDAPPERYEKVLKILAKKYSRIPLQIILTPQNQTNPKKVAEIVLKYCKNFSSLAVSFLGGEKIRPAVAALHRKGVINYLSPEKPLAILDKIIRPGKLRKAAESRPKIAHLKIKTNLLIQKALGEKITLLSWKDTETIFKEYGIDVLKSWSLGNLAGLSSKKFPFPCVLKTDDPQIAHRWDKQAVALDLKNSHELRKAFLRIKKFAKAKSFLVQPMLRSGLEIIVGMKRDQNFGPVIIVGSGGTLAEILQDRLILIPPINPAEIYEKIKALSVLPILKGYRGDRGYKISEIARIAKNIEALAAENPDIVEIDINPLILYNDHRKYQIVDAKIFLKKP